MDKPTIGLQDLKKLRTEWAKAIANGYEEFAMTNSKGETCQFVTMFAYYLIKHLEQLKKQKP